MRIAFWVTVLAAGVTGCLLLGQQNGPGPAPQGAPKKAAPPKPVPTPWISVKHLQEQIEFRNMEFDLKPAAGSDSRRGKPEMRGYKDAYLFWLRQRAYPYDQISWAAYSRAFAQEALMLRASFRLAPAAHGVLPPAPPPKWEFIGPSKLPVPYRQYYGQGYTSGRVSGISIDPTNDNVIYLATAGGGLWKTTDKGQTWRPLSESERWDNTKTGSVAIDPNNSQTVYAGTGDFDGGFGVYGFGIMRSTNGGDDWTNVARQELKGYSVRRILVDPDDSKIVTAAAGRNQDSVGRLVRSTDGGSTWTVIPMAGIAEAGDAEWEDLKCGAKAPNNSRVCYAVGAAIGGQVLRTRDQGAHWTKLHPPLSANYQAALAVATSPMQPGTVYLLTGTDRHVLKSTDNGDTWKDVTHNLPCGDDYYNWSQSDYDFFIEVSTRPDTGSDVVYVGLIDVIASTNGGESWISVGQTYDQDQAWTHNDQHSLAVNPKNPNEVYLGNDGGVYRVTYDPSKDSWSFDTSLNATLGLTQFYSIAADATGTHVILGGAQDNATPIAFGDFGKWSNVGGGDGGRVLVHPSNPDVQYAAAQFLEIYRTRQNWRDWNPNQPVDSSIAYVDTVGGAPVAWSGDPTSFLAPIAFDPNNPDILYAGTNYLWRRNETTGSWDKHLGSQMLAEDSQPSVPANRRDALSVIAVAGSDSKTIYTGSQTGLLWTTNDSGSSWKQLSGDGSGLPRYWITSIAVHPSKPKTFLVALSGTSGPGATHPGHLWRCTFAVSKFTCQNVSGTGSGMLPNIPINKALIDPDKPDTLYYVATDIGVFMSRDGGQTWGDATRPLGLPNVQVNDLALIPGTGYLLAATFGRGAWRIQGLSSATLAGRTPRPAARR